MYLISRRKTNCRNQQSSVIISAGDMGMQQELNKKSKWRTRHATDCIWGTMVAEGRNNASEEVVLRLESRILGVILYPQHPKDPGLRSILGLFQLSYERYA